MFKEDITWIYWFFYGSRTVWICAAVGLTIMVACILLNRYEWVIIGAAILTTFAICLGMLGGLYNVNQRMERCHYCGKILHPEYAYSYCEKHIDMA